MFTGPWSSACDRLVRLNSEDDCWTETVDLSTVLMILGSWSISLVKTLFPYTTLFRSPEDIKSVLIVIEIFYQISPPHSSIYTSSEDEWGVGCWLLLITSCNIETLWNQYLVLWSWRTNWSLGDPDDVVACLFLRRLYHWIHELGCWWSILNCFMFFPVSIMFHNFLLQ